MERRQFVAALGTMATGSLVGCSMPFQSAELTDPRLVTNDTSYGSEPAVDVVVQNTGGQEGTFNGTVRVTNDTVEFSQEVSVTVPPGENATVRTDPVDVPAAGAYEFALVGRPPSATQPEEGTVRPQVLHRSNLVVSPDTLQAGESVTVADRLRVAVDSCSVQDTVFVATGGEPSGVFRAPTGAALGLYRITIENVSTESLQWDPQQALQVPGGDIYSNGAVGQVADAGPALSRPRTLDPSATVSGHVVAKLPKAVATDTPALAIDANPQTETPEYRWQFPNASADGLAEVTLDDVSAPDSATAGEGYPITLTFSNSGDGTGTGRAVLQYKTAGGWQTVGEWTLLESAESPLVETEVPPGETVTTTVTNTPAEGVSRTVSYRALPTGTTWKTSF
ncbi:hypothetical protein [Halococcoides cellulosivorans]|uniref:Uncharacterized protein n=1 Tax=Halococcoides cellulosivorans TaxID=1679096 RepID=A0A2R4WYG9_9EURY|nr:hypothetical protein [Halococcoides cellulosivorans]AWB26584.1 hypothetical protein HARCEL1_02080 [Halococcoides cellulosivorans]